jgi:hypothetical protein
MRMNISVPDALAEQVRQRNLPISSICQRALREEVSRLHAIEATTDLQVYIAADEPDPNPATWPNFDPARPHLVYGHHPVHGEGWMLDHEEGGIDGFFPGYRSDVDAVLDRARALLRHGAESRMKEITVDIGDPSLTVGFTGHWLVEPSRDETRTAEDGYDAGAYWGIALTKRGRIAVYTAQCNERWPARLDDYDGLGQAAEHVPADIVAQAAAELGETRVVWRDI